MAVRIRLTRTGQRHQPSYRIVAAEARVKRDGKFIENLGWYNPLSEPAQLQYDQERLKYWLSQGAQMSDRVRHLVTGEKRLRTKSKAKKGEEKVDEKAETEEKEK
jgi:small subunit ribosomal protein S16